MNKVKSFYYRITIPMLIGIVVFYSCENSIEQVNRLTEKSELPQIAIVNAEILYSDSARVKMKMTAPLIEEFKHKAEEPFTEMPQGLKMFFYDKNMQVESNLSADYAKYFEKKDLWECKGNVKIVNTRGDILKTEQLFADRLNEKLYTDQYVKITKSDGSEMAGEGGFESNLDFTDYVFKKVNWKNKDGNSNKEDDEDNW